MARPLLIITDAGLDPDDEVALALASSLHRAGRIDVRAVVANLNPSEQRARLVKGTLNSLGVDAPVAAGSGCHGRHTPNPYEFDVPYLAEPDALHSDGQQLLADTLSACRDAEAVLLLISGLTDAAQLLASHSQLVQAKVGHVAIMGGIDATGSGVRPDSASNNRFDPHAAEVVYPRLVELGVPTSVLTRHAAYAAAVPRAFYERLAGTGHPVAARLLGMQQQAMNHLWRASASALGHPDRGSLPARCDRAWFLRTLCGLEHDPGRAADEPVWDLVRRLNLFDPLTLLSVVEPQLFEPVPLGGIDVLGVDEHRPGVRVPAQVRERLQELLVPAFQ